MVLGSSRTAHCSSPCVTSTGCCFSLMTQSSTPAVMLVVSLVVSMVVSLVVTSVLVVVDLVQLLMSCLRFSW